MSNKWMELLQVEMEIKQQVGQASQMKESSQKGREPVKPGSQTARSKIANGMVSNQEVGKLDNWEVVKWSG